jgi:xanthine permease XanP
MRPGFAPRAADRKVQRPPEAIFGLDDKVPFPTAAGLAFQHLAVQAIFLVLPAAIAAGFGLGPREATNFLCLSLLAVALFAALQGLRKGPIGAGYQVPAIPSPVFVGIYLLCAGAGLTPDRTGALLVLAGAVAIAASLLIRRPQVLVPAELAGLVVVLLGVSLVPVMLDELRLRVPAVGAGRGVDVAITLAAFLVMVGSALSRTRLAPYGVLVGAGFGWVVVALLPGDSGLLAILAANPWLAWPEPILPRFEGLPIALVLGFTLAIVPAKAVLLGNLLALQRAADAEWRKPDGGPLRRGLLANALTLAATGAFGGMAPSASAACVGLSIANRTLAPVIAMLGAAMMAALAFSPKLVALFVAMPGPVKTAMVLYAACFIIATGCQLITARMLDVRRSLVVGLGLVMGLSVVIAPRLFAEHLPALASPLTFGALTGFLLHFATAPFMVRQASFALPLDASLPRVAEDQAVRLGGAWGAKRSTMEKVEHFWIEIGEVLATRGLATAQVQARHAEGEVAVSVRFTGPPLPAPTAKPHVSALEGEASEQEAFILWLATREASRLERRDQEWRAVFEDV